MGLVAIEISRNYRYVVVMEFYVLSDLKEIGKFLTIDSCL